VPAATIRSGSTAEAPVVVIATGRICVIPAFGISFIARKSKCSATYCAMTGLVSSPIANSWSVSHCTSAFGSVERSCTVSYGPTTWVFKTSTPPPPPLLDAELPAAAFGAPPKKQSLGGDGQFSGGGWTTVVVELSRTVNI